MYEILHVSHVVCNIIAKKKIATVIDHIIGRK